MPLRQAGSKTVKAVDMVARSLDGVLHRGAGLNDEKAQSLLWASSNSRAAWFRERRTTPPALG